MKGEGEEVSGKEKGRSDWVEEKKEGEGVSG